MNRNNQITLKSRIAQVSLPLLLTLGTFMSHYLFPVLNACGSTGGNACTG